MSVNNIEKILQYIEPIAKSPINVDGTLYSNQADKIFLSTSFMYGDSCNMCGKCCIPEHNIFTSSEYSNILKCTELDYTNFGLDYNDNIQLKDNLKEECHTINGKCIKLYKYRGKKQNYTIPDRGTIDRCTWLRQKSEDLFVCGIHPVTSITCVMPHLRFWHNKQHNNLYIGTMQYGRNWALKCGVEFDKNSIDLKIDKLTHLKLVCDDLGIETYIDDIIKVAKSLNINNYTKILNKTDIKAHSNNRRLF